MGNYSDLTDKQLKELSGQTQDKYQGMTDEKLAELAGGKATTANSSLVNSVAGGALIGGGLALGAGTKWALDPFLKKGKIMRKEVKPIMQKYKISKEVPPSRLLSELDIQETKVIELGKISVIKDTANNLTKNYPAWRNKMFENYMKSLNNIDVEINRSGLGVPMESSSFGENVLQRTADNLRGKGLEREAVVLEKYATGLKKGDPIQFSKAKQVLTNISKNNPKMGRVLMENFGEYLATDKIVSNTKAGVLFKTLQGEYAAVKPIDVVASRLINRKTGMFDTQKITKQIISYVKGEGNPQLGQLLKKMGSKQALTEGIGGVSQQISQLDNLAKEISDIKNTKIQIKQINNKLQGLQSKIKTRGTIAKGAAWVGAGVGALAKLGTMFSMAAMPMAGAVAAKEFESWREQAGQNPNSISKLNPMTGMPETVNLEDLVI